MPSTGLRGLQTQMWYRYACRQNTDTYRIKSYKKTSQATTVNMFSSTCVNQVEMYTFHGLDEGGEAVEHALGVKHKTFKHN